VQTKHQAQTLVNPSVIWLGLGILVVVGVIVWQAVITGGNPDPTRTTISPTAAGLETGVLVFREGLESILVLAALTAGLVRAHTDFWRPIGRGAAAGFLATLVTWVLAVFVLSAVDVPALALQAATGLLAVVVLLIVMNWFFHKIYWTGWISHQNRRRRELVQEASGHGSRTTWGLTLLGFASVYREGFEVVLFLQSLRLQVGSVVVLEGALVGLALTLLVGWLTFVSHEKLPYKRMLVITGVMLGFVLLVMVGESAQELQQAGWIGTTPVALNVPDWVGVWFAFFPNVEGIAAQAVAAVLVLGSYYFAQPRGRPGQPVSRPVSTAGASGLAD
jgi:high-affinity iron transporter